VDGQRINYRTISGTPISPASILISSSSSEQFFGQIDEVAIWNRALGDGTNGTSNEILELYRRGANRIKYQVRTCPDSTCSTSPNWQGPDATNQTYFTELNNNAVPLDSADLTTSDSVNATAPTMTFANFASPQPTANRYFQYRAILESDDTSTNCNYGSGAGWCSPELQSVSAGPTHYDSSSPTVVTKSGMSYYSLTNAIEIQGSGACSSGIFYNLGVGSSSSTASWYYWTGTAWSAAGGTAATSNSAATLTASSDAALTAFGTQLGAGTVYVRAFLESSGSSACQLKSFEIDGTN
jgi:hypothetical protein